MSDTALAPIISAEIVGSDELNTEAKYRANLLADFATQLQHRGVDTNLIYSLTLEYGRSLAAK